MSEINLVFDRESPSSVNEEIEIKAISEIEEKLKYKFFEGIPNERSLTWKNIKDFSEDSKCYWKPNKPGDYTIMVQVINEKTGDISTEMEKYTIKEVRNLNNIEEKGIANEIKNEEEKSNLIKDIIIDKSTLILGEKINIEVIYPEGKMALFRFWIKGSTGWEALTEYTPDNKFTYTTTKIGEEEILIEAKEASSLNTVDDFNTIKFIVEPQPKIEIESFKCLSKKLLVGEEIIFKVGVNYEESRTILYKFLRVDINGEMSCIQDYSTSNEIYISENIKGKYKLYCLVKDIFSEKSYDDRAVMNYEIEPYEKISINNFSSELSSPQLCGNVIKMNSIVTGGKNLIYRYIVEGPIAIDSGYIMENSFQWRPEAEGEYKIILNVKDISYEGDYEDKSEILFKIDRRSERPVKIINILTNKTRGCIKGEPINLKVKAEGGAALKYCFIVYKDDVEKERSKYGTSNWVNFTPEESGEYKVEVRIKDQYSSREYDAHQFIYFKIREYQEAEIDYVLVKSKESYVVGDRIEFEIITQNTNNILLRYVTKINGHEVEDTGFVKNKYIRVKPKCAGKYTFDIYAKNELCREEYDVKKELSVYVSESIPVTETKIKVDTNNIKVGKEVTFVASSKGGKDVCYEFYIMEKGNWKIVQPYSRKKYYTFLPFVKGNYRILVLSKSYYKKVSYEDYFNLDFKVEDNL